VERLALGRDVLDKQVVDEAGERMGRVDGIVLELPPDGPPRVAALALGAVVLAARLHPRAMALVHGLRRWSARRWRIRRTARYLLPWRLVREVRPRHVAVAVRAEGTPAQAWECWLLTHVVERLPALPGSFEGGPDPRKGKPLRRER
jgi:hypothetical protein